MQVRDARMEDADEACRVIRRSITELCHCDHLRDASTLTMWLANKTGENMRRWIDQNHVIVAIEGKAIIEVWAIRNSGEIMLNYVSPDARFRGVSKALTARLETLASGLGLSAVTLQSSATARKFYLSAGYTENGLPVKGVGVTFGYPMAKQLTVEQMRPSGPRIKSVRRSIFHQSTTEVIACQDGGTASRDDLMRIPLFGV